MEILHTTDVIQTDERFAGYRIPAIVCTADGVLVTAFECRVLPPSDYSTRAVGIRRSADGGRTWSPLYLAVSDQTATINNPVLVVNGRGEILLLYLRDYRRLFLSKSADGGQTFFPVRELTDEIDDFRAQYKFNVLAAGPGHGIRLKNGRLLVPVWMAASPDVEPRLHHPSMAGMIYSDDDGEHFSCGHIIYGSPEFIDPSETVAAELPDGRVLCTVRHEGAERYRAFTRSDDGAHRFSPLSLDRALPDAVCFGSLLCAGGAVYLSNCADQRARANLTLRRSTDEGKSFSESLPLYPRSSYSDLAASPDGKRLYCFYERDMARETFYPAALTIAEIALRIHIVENTVIKTPSSTPRLWKSGKEC